jgi:hypothetical protein
MSRSRSKSRSTSVLDSRKLWRDRAASDKKKKDSSPFSTAKKSRSKSRSSNNLLRSKMGREGDRRIYEVVFDEEMDDAMRYHY